MLYRWSENADVCFHFCHNSGGLLLPHEIFTSTKNEINLPGKPIPNLNKVILETREVASEIKRLKFEIREEKPDPYTFSTK